MKTKAVLIELFELLEAYAPSWYSEEQRDRAIAALKYTDRAGLRLLKSGNHPGHPQSSIEPGTLLQ